MSMPIVTNQLRPFNPVRFDEVMSYLSQEHHRHLSQYDMVKLHIMGDVYQLLRAGKPIIGGPLSRWKFGPVVTPAFKRIRAWAHEWDRDSSHQPPESFRIVRRKGKTFYFEPTEQVDASVFSKSELASLKQAWDCVMTKDWAGSQAFFHEPGESFMGRVWHAVGVDGAPIDWSAIVDAYAEDHPEFKNSDQIKALIAL